MATQPKEQHPQHHVETPAERPHGAWRLFLIIFLGVLAGLIAHDFLNGAVEGIRAGLSTTRP